jgi:hypothetical protein
MYPREFRSLTLLLLSAMWIAAPASAQTKESINYGANLGSLSYEVSTQAAQCTSEGYGVIHYTIYTFDTFSFVSAGSGTQPISGSTYWDVGIGGRLIGSGDCPLYPSGGNITYTGTGNYTINIIPHSNGALSSTIGAPGYINPKYVVVGVIYAPPGGVVQGGVAKGNVSYTDSDLVSSTITTKQSFGNSYTESNVVTLPGVGFNILGWVSGSVSGQLSSSYTTSTTTTDSTAVTVQKTSGTTLGVNGPECPYVGVDHDYDIIEVWLNPVQLFTLTNNGVVQPNGYGYSTLDQPGMDVYDVYAGELNGDIAVRSSTTTAFARAWAAGEVWPSGQGPGLTSQDEQNILKADPFWDCTYQSPVGDGFNCPEPADASFSGVVDTSGTAVTLVSGSNFSNLLDQGSITINSVAYPIAQVNSATTLTLGSSAGTQTDVSYSGPSRFTESGGDQNFPYTQPVPGGSPNFTIYTFSYTNTDTQGADVVYKTSQTSGYELVFKGSVFGVGIGDTFSQSWTTTQSYETSSQFTSSNTTTATATIWQPPCNVVSGLCSPVYPPSNAYSPIPCTEISNLGLAFGQGDSMYIYQDNLFGTFLIEPYGQ